MKRFFLSTVLLLLSIIAGFAQVTFEKTYDYSATIVNLETIGFKYYLMDVPNSECRMYNMDHSLYKTIDCPVPNGYFLADIKYVSEQLFDTDSEIELAFTYYKIVTTSTSYYYIYGAKVITENGNVLQTIDNAQYIYINQTDNYEYKLFAYCFDYSVSPETVWTNIYGVPGTSVSVISSPNSQEDIFLNAYPNPAKDVIKLEYQLPVNVINAQLYVIDSNGNMVKDFMIDSHSNNITMNVNDLSTGVYYYHIKYDKYQSESRKIIVQ
ncbi:MULTISPECIES: T9SS type A sorting domain-containing protein [unclassified Lentimicrobium]|uniref:T9SS type A sorting domain-containing protein n=1 Tax=unclassified Lentimicrobium TaxID=2677434 RepID=UPI001551FB56|nr:MULTISPECIES: T9SS type A sorting domain-containing protein [unclassified Lentimicrobium]NPD47100.1 T9SS type A sorting domain-containing protein [Lentimicrobium sp. S6]NPD85748.1 T9SS type A sorting domain-containing protein [Lentimicrobium sp. L6]